MSINREGAPLIWTHTKLKKVRMKENKMFTGEEKKLLLSLGFILSWFGLLEEEVAGFSHLRFTR